MSYFTQSQHEVIRLLVDRDDWISRKKICEIFKDSNYSSNHSSVNDRMKRLIRKTGDCITWRRNGREIEYKANLGQFLREGFIVSIFRVGPPYQII